MTIRGGGNPNSAMACNAAGRMDPAASEPCPQKRMTCFMVETPCGFNRIQAWFARFARGQWQAPPRIIAADPPDHGQPAAVLAFRSRTSLRRR